MDFKKRLHEIIDTLDDNLAKQIYDLVIGILGRAF